MNSLTFHFCCGCGLCSTVISGGDNSQGFYRPFSAESIGDGRAAFDEASCYVNQLQKSPRQGLWGEIDAAYYGHSNDANIRKMASSGGILTELVRYLLRKQLIDEVLTVEVPDGEGTTTQPTRLRHPDDAYRCLGSKYTASKTLYGFLDTVELGKRYAIVGRPCEVRTLRAYLNANIPECEVVYLSFFCGGTPSKQANDKLLEVMGVGKGELESLSYRGNGWPGKTHVGTKSGRQVEMDYETSWGEILGRDIQPVCRYCWEGTGEAADIVCGDGWYLVDGKPSFEERPGRNIILARSNKGNKLLMDMKGEGLISLELIDDISVLDRMQPGQYSRKTSMFSRVLAAKLMRRPVPPYKIADLLPYAKLVSININVRMFLGTIRRALSGRL